MAVDVVGLFMALLSFVESAPRAYRLKASNAAPPFSTSAGTSAGVVVKRHINFIFALLALQVFHNPSFESIYGRL
jgi:hypothetical protein